MDKSSEIKQRTTNSAEAQLEYFGRLMIPVSYNNIYYIPQQSCSHTETIKILAELNEWTDIIDVSKDIKNKLATHTDTKGSCYFNGKHQHVTSVLC